MSHIELNILASMHILNKKWDSNISRLYFVSDFAVKSLPTAPGKSILDH